MPLRAMSVEESCAGLEGRRGEDDFSREEGGGLSSSPEESPPARASSSASRSAMATASGRGRGEEAVVRGGVTPEAGRFVVTLSGNTLLQGDVLALE